MNIAFKYPLLGWLTLGSAGLAVAAPPVMRDAATHEQLLARKKAEGEPALPEGMKPCQGADPSKTGRPGDLIERSDLLCHGGVATLVPKRALLAVPERFRSRLAMRDGSQVVTWEEFLAIHREWITTVEVTLDEAAGRALLPDKTVRRVAESGNVVVATFLGGPISVLEYRPVPEAGTTKK
ncbi:MAG: hypothetical protein J0M04_21745 [Verrucomicrobia bacterium]|nr:hypothetical protein [Verrucomicrobiota bacterium]